MGSASARSRSSRPIIGTARHESHVLPVPLPAERRNVDTDFEQLAGHLTLDVSGRISYRGETDLAGLEIGYRPTQSHVATVPTGDGLTRE